jgi:hypothetical protein
MTPRKPSSVTDRAPYLDLCARAAVDDRVFMSFRRDPILIAMFEHVTEEQGAAYLDIIKRDSPDLLGEQFALYRRNDKWGSPITHEYPKIGRVSPVTLRYLKIISDLELLFGDLTGKRIVEIGVGYGGQARLVLARWRVQSYTLVDLEPVLDLARRYLNDPDIQRPLNYVPPSSVVQASYDLCISNYSFSELDRNVQSAYAGSLVSSADRGYLICNVISQVHGIESWSKSELGQMHPGAHWIPEEPLTFAGNEVLVWGDAR